jgi:hypothetical protein
MDKAAKLILNSLRCPICKSQIDMLGHAQLSHKKQRPYNYCCASNAEHYGLWFIHWEQPIRIESETAIVYDGCYQYEIKQQHSGPGLLAPKPDYTEITVRKVDAENRIIDNIKPKVFDYYKRLFDFANTTRDKIVLRIRTILVFQ